MSTIADTETGRRRYKRRTDEEKIVELERRIADLKAKQVAKEKKTDPVMKEIPKLQRRLRKFAQMAMDNNRPDIANSVTAFSAGLDRTLHAQASGRTPSAPPAPED